MLSEGNAGGNDDVDGRLCSGIRQEQIEKSLERKIRLSWERKQRERSIWEDMSKGRMDGFIVIVPISSSTSVLAAVDVEHEGVSKYKNVFSLELWFKSDD